MACSVEEMVKRKISEMEGKISRILPTLSGFDGQDYQNEDQNLQMTVGHQRTTQDRADLEEGSHFLPNRRATIQSNSISPEKQIKDVSIPIMQKFENLISNVEQRLAERNN